MFFDRKLENWFKTQIFSRLTFTVTLMSLQITEACDGREFIFLTD